MAKETPSASILHKCRRLILLMNIHLNHFPKHEKYGLCQEIRQTMYGVYALLVECQKRYHNKTSLTKLDVQHEQLRALTGLAFELGYYTYKDNKLELSRWTIQPIKRGLNFVGFRTWQQTRMVRRHSLHNFGKALKAGRLDSLISIMGNAKRSASYSHFRQRILLEAPELLSQLPSGVRDDLLQIHKNC